MTDIKFGWHMHSFPTDGSQGAEFITQITNTLNKIQGHFASVWADDHVHPWGDFVSADTDALECATTIAYLAGLYPQLHFGSLVMCQSYRNPGLLAKMAANLQLFSGGRFILGIGAGWMVPEYNAYNWEYPKASVRIAQMEETIQIARKLWTESPATFEGKYYRITDAYCHPQPDPQPPIMVGGDGEKLTLRVVAKHADWWNMNGSNPEMLIHKLNVLKSHCQAIGRNFEDITITWAGDLIAIAPTEAEARQQAEASPYNSPHAIVGTPEQVAEKLRVYADLGVQHTMLRFADFPDTAGIELFCKTVIPQF